MKEKGLTYSELAKVLGLSHSSVKRIMASESLSLERISIIADWLGMTVFELFELARNKDSPIHTFTTAQDALLAKEGLAAYIFLQLLVGFSVDEIKKRDEISDAKMFGILRKLDQVELIQLNPDTKILVRTRGPFAWREQGSMDRKYSKRFIEVILENFRKKLHNGLPREGNSQSLLKPFELYLGQDSIDRLKVELLEVIKKFRSQAAWEKQHYPSNEFRVISGFVGFDFWNAWEKVLLNKK
jgi:transcriptional regulator with XRE-family HTH domain